MWPNLIQVNGPTCYCYFKMVNDNKLSLIPLATLPKRYMKAWTSDTPKLGINMIADILVNLFHN